MRVRTSGAWKEVSGGRVRVAGAWKNLTRVRAYVGGAWKDVASFTQPLTALTITPSSISRTATEGETFTTQNATAAPTGGRAPFSYSCVRLSGDTEITVLSPSSATSAFYLPTPDVGTYQTVFRWTCTDADGGTAQANITVTITVVFAPSGGIS